MCVICAKAKGVEMPSEEYIMNMWLNNNDGAGLMYADGGRVHIEKGFMTYEAFAAKLDELKAKYSLKDLALVMHFRITTHGGTKPENTHPFPVTESVGMLQKTKSQAKVAIAHNGIIDITPRKGISDTMEYVVSQLAPLSKAVPTWYKNKYLMQMVENAIDSKMCIMNEKGELFTIGKFIEEDGIFYSNASYSYNLKYYPNYFGAYTKDDGGWNYWKDAEGYYDYYSASVMWLDDGDYVITKSGQKIPNDIDRMFAIDEQGYLFEYDYELGALEEIIGTAYSHNNMKLKYDESKALEEMIAI